MNPTPDPHQQVADSEAMQAGGDILWFHAAFCRVALPLRGQKAPWRRGAGKASVRMEPGAAGLVLPGGALLRLLLLHVCDAAHRTVSPVVELGDTAGALAARIGLPGRAGPVAEQMQRLLGARISVSLDGGPELGVFDARGRPRSGEGQWRPSLRLTRGFFASLAESAVPLDRRVVEALRDSPVALDAYAWVRQALHGRDADGAATATWEDLLDAFGTASQGVDAFRPVFEAALQAVRDADASVEVEVSAGGVTLRRRLPAAAPAPEAAPEPPPAGPRPPEVPAQPLTLAEPPAQPVPVPAEPVPDTPAAEEAPQAEHRPPPPCAQQPRAAAVPETISLGSRLTGLRQVIWLRRGYGADSALVGVTPSERFDAERLTLLTVEPMVMQVSGGLSQQDFERVSSWVIANRELIDDIWAGQVTFFDEIERRITKVPAPGWR